MTFRSICRALLKDERDEIFVRVILKATLLLPMALGLYAIPQGRWLALAAVPYLALVFYWLGPFVLMGHVLAHRPGTFRPGYRWIAAYSDWALGPLFGLSPFTYIGHHIGMHHPENNLAGDLSSTMQYQRDSFAAFLRYWLDFFFIGFARLVVYLRGKRKSRMLVKTVAGELSFLAVFAVAFWLRPAASIVVFGIPLVVSRFAMLAGNWAQHAFVHPEDPASPLLNSITCVETPYNARCFNDGFHAIHHIKPAMHWAELPEAFAKSEATFRERGAVVVRGLDHFQVWVLLMLKQHRVLLAHLVMPTFESEAEGLRFLAERLRPVPA